MQSSYHCSGQHERIMLKGIIFSLRDVLAKRGPVDGALLAETFKLLKFLKKRGVSPVFASNHDWTMTEGKSGKSQKFQEVLESQLGPVSYYVGGQDGMPFKPRAAAVGHILTQQGWKSREVLFVGNSDVDMRAARNGGVLFLNAVWHGEANPYGYQFESPIDIARFVDCLCLGLHGWFWALEKDALRVFALAPFTTLSPSYAVAHAYSADARATAKDGARDPTFWGRLLAARVYFSGLVDEINYITAYPGHAPDSKQPVVAEALTILAQSLHRQYLPDLVIRHKKAQKSQTTRAAGGSVGIENQLETIMLNAAPKKGLQGQPYKNNPLSKGKTVLLVDDFCTEGNSFEAGRAFIEATGAKVICLSWLKTINTSYNAVVGRVPIPDPYAPVHLAKKIPVVAHSYGSAIVDPKATTDLAQIHKSYFDWSWPEDL